MSKRLSDLLRSLLPPSYSVRRDDPLTLVDSEPEPDVAVVVGTDDRFWNSHPKTAELVIEVAVTSLVDDREMAPIYAEAGVKEYWIVVPEKRQIEVYRQPESGQYREQRIYTEQDTLTCTSVPGVSFPLAGIFAAPAR
jgi:Uma2 family endonuclease